MNRPFIHFTSFDKIFTNKQHVVDTIKFTFQAHGYSGLKLLEINNSVGWLEFSSHGNPELYGIVWCLIYPLRPE